MPSASDLVCQRLVMSVGWFVSELSCQRVDVSASWLSRRSRYTAVYRSSTKYSETARVSRVSTIPCSSYHLAMCTLQACDAETNSKVTENHNYHSTTMSARPAVNKYHPISYFCISKALLTTLTELPISKTDLALLNSG